MTNIQAIMGKHGESAHLAQVRDLKQDDSGKSHTVVFAMLAKNSVLSLPAFRLYPPYSLDGRSRISLTRTMDFREFITDMYDYNRSDICAFHSTRTKQLDIGRHYVETTWRGTIPDPAGYKVPALGRNLTPLNSL